MMRIEIFLALAVFSNLVTYIHCRQHHLVLENDSRNYFRMSTFGFWQGGKLEVKLNHLTFHSKFYPKLGLTLTKTVSDSITPYMESQQNKCFLADDALTADGNIKIISFLLDLINNQLLINCTGQFPFLTIKTGPGYNMTLSDAHIVHDELQQESSIQKRSAAENNLNKDEKTLKDVEKGAKKDSKPTDLANADKTSNVTELKSTNVIAYAENSKACSSFKIPFKSEIMGQRRKISDVQFLVSMDGPEALGLYSLYFHNCPEPDEPSFPINLSISIIEQNGDNYLSAGEMPLPNLYFFMSFLFFVTGCVWIAVLRKKREEVFKIHHLMGVLVFLKSLSLLFHGINYYIINRDGYPMEAWAVLYYITHLLKGALLFITIVLIGTGWAFIKHILSDKDKKIFMIVIPLQVLANVAKIIMEESEEGESQHYTWKEIFILVDLICCGAILFPVVWSIRHLQEASHTDGKAAINLEKLKLFRHFYVMIICYIYFTRIIVYLLKITVIFQYEWLDEFFREGATFIFFIVTGINFQPTASNPYFRLSQDDDLEMEEVITQTGFTKNATKTVRSRDTNAQNEDGITTKRESSHEYD